MHMVNTIINHGFFLIDKFWGDKNNTVMTTEIKHYPEVKQSLLHLFTSNIHKQLSLVSCEIIQAVTLVSSAPY